MFRVFQKRARFARSFVAGFGKVPDMTDNIIPYIAIKGPASSRKLYGGVTCDLVKILNLIDVRRYN